MICFIEVNPVLLVMEGIEVNSPPKEQAGPTGVFHSMESSGLAPCLPVTGLASRAGVSRTSAPPSMPLYSWCDPRASWGSREEAD